MNNPADGTHQSNWVRFWWIGFDLLLALSLLADIFVEHHAPFGFKDFFGFYACYGLGAGIALVVIAKVVAIFLRRKESYYEQN